MTDALSFLDAVAGYARASSRSSADRPIRLATIDPAYSPWTNYPDAPEPARVTFEGESTLSAKAYGYAAGFIPWAGTRVFMVPIGNTYIIGGMINSQTPQGFWSNAAGTASGAEFGAGTYFDSEEGLVVAGDVSVAGDLDVSGVGRFVEVVKPSNTGRIVATVSADPDLVLNLSAGTWRVEFCLIMGAANGDLKTAWAVTGTTATYSLKTCWGPSPYTVDTATADETQGRDAVPMRVGVHQYGTEVEYGINSASLYTSAREWGVVRLTTSGSVALSWSQAAVDTPTPSVIVAGSTATARKVGS